MKHFDVVVVGGGPSGGHCARQLTKSGKKVLLVEQHQTFYHNDFSSAATPMETLEKFKLPPQVIGSFWQKLAIVSTNSHQTWESNHPLGVVFNFAKLREFLAQEVQHDGGEVWMGYRYLRHFEENGKTCVEFQKRPGVEKMMVSTQVLVDATGPARAVMYNSQPDPCHYLTATGTEYLIEVAESDYQHYANQLIFFLGHKWMPQGYSWIFPMDNSCLKVGAARYNSPHKHLISSSTSIRLYIELLLKDYLQNIPYKILNVHGGVIKYCRGLNDLYYRDNIIAIGDAVSSINMLGGEGIRHGMENAEVACRYIESYLCHQLPDFSSYQHEIRQTYKRSWDRSEKMSLSKYLEYSDEWIDRGVAYLNHLTVEDIMKILFDYDFKRLYRGFFKYFRYKLARIFQNLKLRSKPTKDLMKS